MPASARRHDKRRESLAGPVGRAAIHQLQLTMASRLGSSAPVQRWFARSSVEAALDWLGYRADPVADLHRAERSVWSQLGEDGLLEALIERTGGSAETFVEIGAADGEQNCTRMLAEQGARGFWFEADPERARRAQKVAEELDVAVTCATVSAENVTSLLRDVDAPRRPDVIVLDIDGNDFWVLRSLLRDYTPRIFVVEYNSTFPPGEFWVRRKRRRSMWNETYRHGASLQAMTWLAERAGYRLVACTSTGVNAFFVPAALAEARGLGIHPLESLYRPTMVAPPLIGHPYTNSPNCPRLDERDAAGLHVEHAEVIGRRPLDEQGSATLVGVLAKVRNDSARLLTSTGSTAVHLSGHVLDEAGAIVQFEGERNWLHGGLQPHSTGWVGGLFRVTDPRARALRICLVQDSVAWIEDSGFDLRLEPSTH